MQEEAKMRVAKIKEYARHVSAETDSDLFLLNGDISRAAAKQMYDNFSRISCKRPNASLLLCTYGGDPNAAYLIADLFKKYYKIFTIYVFGICKSAGTLIALGADQIVMGAQGEFGPIDIQLSKPDELLSSESGLIYLQALTSLQTATFSMFEHFFINIKRNSGDSIKTKTAAEIATNLAVGVMSPIAAQLDPLRLGEVNRALAITQAYGSLLTNKSDAVTNLTVGYPSHGFVINFKEAKKLFGNVRQPNETETVLELLLEEHVKDPCDSVLNVWLSESEDNNEEENHEAREAGPDGGNFAAPDGNSCGELPESIHQQSEEFPTLPA
jgi:hypothetical protein